MYTIIKPPPDAEMEAETIKFGNLDFTAIKDKREGFRVTKYQRQVRNLLFTIVDARLIVENSLHKFYHGENYSDFNVQELNSTICEIEYLTGIKAENFILTRIEFGLNILMDQPVISFLTSIANYKKKHPFDRMKSKGLMYGLICDLVDYSIKFYSKVQHNEILQTDIKNTYLLRVEMVFNRQRKFRMIKTLEHLRCSFKRDQLYELFKSTIKDVMFVEELNLSTLTSRERELFFAGKDPKFWQAELKYNDDQGKDKRRRYDDILKELNKVAFNKEIIRRCDDKYSLLS